MGYTDNPSAEVNDVMTDHPHMEFLIKDLFHSLRIVSEATDPAHPHASETSCLGGMLHALLGTLYQLINQCMHDLSSPSAYSHALHTALQVARSIEHSQLVQADLLGKAYCSDDHGMLQQ